MVVLAIFFVGPCHAVEVEEVLDSTTLDEVIVVSRRKEIIKSQRLDGVQLQSLNSQNQKQAD